MSPLPREPKSVTWIKSSYSTSSGGECLEASPSSAQYGAVPVRDSKTPAGPLLSFSTGAWADFVRAVGSRQLPA